MEATNVFNWRRKRREATELAQLRSVLMRNTLELVRIANQAEIESSREGSPDSTDARELARTAKVRHAQKVFLDHVVSCCDSGLTLTQISDEIIDPIVAKSIVSDVAWYAISQAMRNANDRLNRP